MRIVVNRCFGGYSLSEAAYAELGIPWDKYGFAFDEDRGNPALVACVEKLGPAASGPCSELTVVAIPDDVDWEIEEYDGQERIVERHRRSW